MVDQTRLLLPVATMSKAFRATSHLVIDCVARSSHLEDSNADILADSSGLQ